MGWTCLALWGLLATGSEPEAVALVARLGSGRYADREAAATALEALGPEAETALRTARSAGDAEVRHRAAELLERIARRRLTEPTRVRLDVEDVPIGEIVRSLAEEHGFRLEPTAEVMARKITVHELEPLTFWQASRRLGLAPRWSVGSPPPPYGTGRPPVLRLASRDPSAARRTYASGPCLVELRGIRALGREGLTLGLDVLAEPGRLLRTAGPVKIVEAIDERGLSVVPLPRAATTDERRPLRPDPPAPQLSIYEGLLAPGGRGKVLKRLRGSVPLTISARKAEPTSIPLLPSERAEGRTFAIDDQTWLIQGVREDADRRATVIDLVQQPHAEAIVLIPMRGGRRRWAAEEFQAAPERLWSQIEVVDAEDRPLLRRATPIVRFDWLGLRVSLSFPNSDDVGPPARLLAHDSFRAPLDVEFEFRDVPLP